MANANFAKFGRADAKERKLSKDSMAPSLRRCSNFQEKIEIFAMKSKS
jgi:hypothetical protein